MNKYVLPSAAAFLILVIAFSSYTPAMAVARITVTPFLSVVTIPEDDQLRQTGVMLLGVANHEAGTDFLAQYKLVITLNGVLVPTSGLIISCNVAEKDKIVNPPDTTTGKSPTYPRQFPHELIETSIKDVADWFVCKPRWKPGGLSVGVLDVYFTGAAGDAAFIADHILVVHVMYTVGRQIFYGTDIQDICVLGWSMQAAVAKTTLASNEVIYYFADPLDIWSGCESLALYQLNSLGLFP
jgi:hypothetical protein